MNGNNQYRMIPRVPLRAPEVPEGHKAYNIRAKQIPAWEVRKEMLRGYPRHMYNYLRFEPTSPESMRNVSTMLVDSELYLTDPGKFNDPFEFKNQVIVDPDLMRDLLHKMSDFSMQDMERTPLQRQIAIEGALMQISADPSGALKQALNTEKHGVHCFTPAAKNLLMWSHYGDSHRGICLQFTPSKDVATFISAQAVDYCDEFPHLHIPSIPREDTMAMIMRKGKVWEYEAERRIVMLGIDGRLMSFAPEALTAVILGCRFPDPHVSQIKQMLHQRAERGHPPVTLYRMAPRKNSYGLSARKMALIDEASGEISGSEAEELVWAK